MKQLKHAQTYHKRFLIMCLEMCWQFTTT